MTPAIRIISSMATKPLLAELVALYQTQHDLAVQVESVGGVDAAKRVQAGEVFDLVILARNAMDALAAAGKLDSQGVVDVVRSGVAIGVASGAAHPDISSGEAVKQAVLNATSLGYSTGPSGVQLAKLFERWGIATHIKSRIVQAPPGVPVGALIARGEVALGFQQLSEMLNVPGVDVVGMLPPEIEIITTFSGALVATSANAGPARELLAFLASPACAQAISRQGMEPAIL